MSEQVNFVIEQYDNKTLAEANEQFALIIVQLKAENDKLRELVKDLHADMWASGEWLEPYEQRMRELGVEP